MGQLIIFVILGFMAFAVLKQLLKIVRFFEPNRQQQIHSSEPETVNMTASGGTSSKVRYGRDWDEEIKLSYDLFKMGAITKEEFEQVKTQLLARVGAEA